MTDNEREASLPSETRTQPGAFDKFANASDRFSSRPSYFALCVLIVVLWACTYPLWTNGDTWQLVINTGTTILTFWMVALQRNADRRDNNAIQQKLNAILLAQREIIKRVCALAKTGMPQKVLRELDDALGLEDYERA